MKSIVDEFRSLARCYDYLLQLKDDRMNDNFKVSVNEGYFLSQSNYQHECPICFFLWEDLIESEEKEIKCHYCIQKSKMTDAEILDRRLKIMGHSKAVRTPETLRLMYKVLKDGKA